MNFIEAAIFILFLAVISVPIANRARLPLEIFLVLGSGIISLVTWMPGFVIDPKIIFNLLLPPILFHAAYFTSWHDLKSNIRPISLLAFGLVIFTMLIVAIVAKNIFPVFSWGECFLLGAIISPTDAASATSIIKKIGAPRRIITILEGESLINDATALITFRYSLVAVISGSFSLPVATAQFFVSTLGGVAVGLMVAVLSVFILQKIKSVPAETTLTFITALTAYLVGEHLYVSGVIATVVCGVYFGWRIPILNSSRTRIHAKGSWDTIIFIINGFAFTLIGLELPSILQNLHNHPLGHLVFYGVLISVIVMLARLIWVFFTVYLLRIIFPHIARKDPAPAWSVAFILGWCGMRGIISLAAALSLPIYIAPDIPFPHRDLILFITYCVIVLTLIVPSFSLPFLLRFFKLSDVENKMKQEALARMRSFEGVLDNLQEVMKKEKIPEEIFHEFSKHVDRRINVLQTQLQATAYSTVNREYQAIKTLTLAAIASERKTLLQLRYSAEINDDVFHLLLSELDVEELRAKTLRV